jgi:GT2 family glycosyltransferase
MDIGDPLVCAVMLAYNQKEYTLSSLASVLAMQYGHLRLCLVDNGSTDGTAAEVTARYPDVAVLRTERNLGIAGGYNLGMEHALAQGAAYVLIMNNDIEVASDMLTALLAAARDHPDAGILMPKIYHFYGDQTRIWCAGARWRKFPPGVKMVGADAPDSPTWDKLAELEFAPSCVLLITRQALCDAGSFDPQYYFYQSDWDFSARVREKGYRILLVPAARMWHKVSISTQKGDRPARYWFTMGSGSVAFYLRHASLGVLVGSSIWFILREAVRLKWARVSPFLAGLVYGLARHWQWTD